MRSRRTRRGGWTWYTGSAGWMYRLVVESLLSSIGKASVFICAVPAFDVERVRMHYRYRETTYHIVVKRIEVEGDEESRRCA